MYDIIIIGSGPAGLSAAIYAQRACLDTIVIEKNGISGGQVLNTWEVDNYPGFPGVTGFELSRQFREHANKLGARVVQDEVVQVELSGNVKKVVCEEETYEARCVILASGAHHRTLEVPGEEDHCLIVYAELALLITIIPNPDVISSAITSLILYERN